jgi:hypothetical protein
MMMMQGFAKCAREGSQGLGCFFLTLGGKLNLQSRIALAED